MAPVDAGQGALLQSSHTGPVTFSWRITAVSMWAAEKPHLYVLLLPVGN